LVGSIQVDGTMNRSRQILFLRVSFWVGAVLDALVAIQLLLPDLWASFNGLTTYIPSQVLNFGLVIASSLMWGWTFLLVWADRKPMERKGILLITTFPVVFGLAANNVYAVAVGLTALESILHTLAIQCAIAVLFLFSYFNARKTVNNRLTQ
jgi:hypothetical protein